MNKQESVDRRYATFAAGFEFRETGLNALGITWTEVSKIGEARCHKTAMWHRNKNKFIDFNGFCQSTEMHILRRTQFVQTDRGWAAGSRRDRATHPGSPHRPIKRDANRSEKAKLPPGSATTSGRGLQRSKERAQQGLPPASQQAWPPFWPQAFWLLSLPQAFSWPLFWPQAFWLLSLPQAFSWPLFWPQAFSWPLF